MRNVPEQLPLGLDQRLDATGHDVKVLSEVAEFVTPLQQFIFDARCKFSCGKFLRSRSQPDHGFRKVPREPVTEQCANQQHRQQTSRRAEHSKNKRTSIDESRRCARKWWPW